ncbi:MAG: apolipoprotein N-acyltransferase [Gammaproteobacteria bacterium]
MMRFSFAIPSLLFAFASGALLTMSFAPFYQGWLAPLALASLFILIEKTPPKISFWQGFCFGFAFFATNLYWVAISINRYGHASLSLTVILTLLLTIILALFFAIPCYCYKRYYSGDHPFYLLLTLPSLWTLQAYGRTLLCTGFPWDLVGYSQLTTPLAGWAPIVGIYGVTFLTAFTAACFAYGYHKNIRSPAFLLALCLTSLFWIMGSLLKHHHWTLPLNPPFKVALVQGNITQDRKWAANGAIDSFQQYWQLSQPLWEKQDIIIWPEDALPILEDDALPLLTRLQQTAAFYHTTLLLGIPTEKAMKYYNTLLVLGTSQGRYDKRHLVPFGEYTPSWLQSLVQGLQIPLSTLTAGASQQAPLSVQTAIIAPTLCYEIIFPESVRQQAKTATLLITLSDDSWFGHSTAAAQHRAMAQFRALETGRPLLFVNNTGLSSFIDAQGNIIAEAPPEKAAVIQHTVTPYTGLTPWVRWGSLPLLMGLLLFLVISSTLPINSIALKKRYSNDKRTPL